MVTAARARRRRLTTLVAGVRQRQTGDHTGWRCAPIYIMGMALISRTLK